MAFEHPTNPRAARVEAAELRAQAAQLLGRAEQLDPTPAPKKKVVKKKPAAKRTLRSRLARKAK